MLKPYFKPNNGPAPLRASCKRRVRFEECDSLGIMWHGRYASFFEDAREALGDKYDMGYAKFTEARVVVPIVALHVDYRIPLEYKQEYVVSSILHWSDAVKLNMEYEIHTASGELATRGYTIQLMVDFDKNLLFDPPAFYATFRAQWESGLIV